MSFLARLRLRDRFTRWSGPDMLRAAQRIFLLFSIANAVTLVPQALVAWPGEVGLALLGACVAVAARLWEYRRGRPVPIWCDVVEGVVLAAVVLATGAQDVVIGVLFTATQARAVLSGLGRLGTIVACNVAVMAAPALVQGQRLDVQKIVGLVATPLVVYVLRILLLRGQAEHRNQRLLLEAVLRRLPSAVVVVDAAGRVLLTNPVAVEVTGWSDDSAGRRLDELVLVDQEGRRVGVAEVLDRPAHEAVAALVRDDGGRRWVAFSAEPLADDAGARLGTVIAMQDVTAQRRHQQRLHHLATHDPLTGLPNRALFRERLDGVARTGAGYAVLLVDLNDFKRVNDTLGHAAGDSLLRAVADRLVHRAGPGATVARLGGDEFAILLADADQAGARRVAAEIRGAFAQPFTLASGPHAAASPHSGAPLAGGPSEAGGNAIGPRPGAALAGRFNGGALPCGGAVGLAIGGPGRAPQDVLAEADLAMYASKPTPAGTPRPRRPR